MYVPCDTCRDKSRCYRFTSMNRDAFLAAATGDVVDCPEHKEQVEGCYDSHINMDAGVRVLAVRHGRVLHYGAPLFLGAR